MKPRLYPENETNFESNGLGPLSDALACTVEENETARLNCRWNTRSRACCSTN